MPKKGEEVFRVNLFVYPEDLVKEVFGESCGMVENAPADPSDAKSKYALFEGSLSDEEVCKKFNELLEVMRRDRSAGSGR
mgnify:CR=1 FL=1